MTQIDTAFHRDADKSRVDLIPPSALEQIGRVFQFGAGKYGDRNWEKYADEWRWCQLIGSTLRHIYAWLRREDADSESGLPHLIHAATNLLMLSELVRVGKGQDDRSMMEKLPESPEPYCGMCDKQISACLCITPHNGIQIDLDSEGWICPKCDRANAPSVTSCPCHFIYSFTIVTNPRASQPSDPSHGNPPK